MSELRSVAAPPVLLMEPVAMRGRPLNLKGRCKKKVPWVYRTRVMWPEIWVVSPLVQRSSA
jgi:hypothetical protein